MRVIASMAFVWVLHVCTVLVVATGKTARCAVMLLGVDVMSVRASNE